MAQPLHSLLQLSAPLGGAAAPQPPAAGQGAAATAVAASGEQDSSEEADSGSDKLEKLLSLGIGLELELEQEQEQLEQELGLHLGQQQGEQQGEQQQGSDQGGSSYRSQGPPPAGAADRAGAEAEAALPRLPSAGAWTHVREPHGPSRLSRLSSNASSPTPASSPPPVEAPSGAVAQQAHSFTSASGISRCQTADSFWSLDVSALGGAAASAAASAPSPALLAGGSSICSQPAEHGGGEVEPGLISG
jgi:hypothetical protein